MIKNNKKVALIIMDGWGHTEEKEHNAIHIAKTPFYDSIIQNYSHTYLEASGLAVGLPDGQMGNSEIGHTTIGAGSAIDTDLVVIEKSINDLSFYKNNTLLNCINHAKNNNAKIHMIGLLSDGGVHSHNSHVYAFLKMASQNGLKNDDVLLHLFTDGRDVAPGTAIKYINDLENKIEEFKVGKIATIGGRYYGMDRAGNIDRIKHVTDILFTNDISEILNRGIDKNIQEYIQNIYNEKDVTGKIDEYLEHVFINDNFTPIKKGDSVFFFNFRADRAKQLTEVILQKKDEYNLNFTSMTQYGEDLKTNIVFNPANINTTLGKELSKASLKHAHISESEKFPHVTFFVNGQSDILQKGENHFKIESRNDIKTHDEAPEMMAKEIVDEAIKQINTHDFIIINFPNADVVGHTGNIEAIIQAVETVDKETQRFTEYMKSIGGITIITADHGNAEIMIDKITGAKHTAHTTNLVPFIIIDNDIKVKNIIGTLADIAPTILDIFDIYNSDNDIGMKGKSLIK